ncbi:PREDICTED: uncharacterized protein LOC104743384 [Camelina sativa]|uniref:Uncharacterized protein LOC104743384 n=1 Tax=Camelina sativa TaxID=90675 RepID=A0ABM0VXX8_CAMSA|nr:PREDICTED: uncharacterized protein LOC104743384 [Camelina sativa]
MTDGERLKVYHALLERSNNGTLKRTHTREVANLLSVPLLTVQRIWKLAKDIPNGEVVDVSHKRKGKCGGKNIVFDLDRIVDIPFNRRKTLRSLAAALKISRTTLWRCLKRGLIKRHSNAIKPRLTENNMRARLQFCLSMLDRTTLLGHPKFVDMHNVVHIDEKWFYMTKRSENYYLHPSEEEPYRTCQSKNYIGKVMFLAAMARPRFDNNGNETFSGKIGVFPFVTMQPAQRHSRNREAGTLELKPMTSIKRENINDFLIGKVLPRIRERWPQEDFEKTIFIQQDNARTHVDPRDEDFRAASSHHGFDIRLMCQPPNSPDLNILDLGFFNAIQTLQHEVCPKTIEELVSAVEVMFDEYPPYLVNRIFVTLQSCMQEIMKV